MSKATFTRSYDVQQLAERLAKLQVGEQITYKDVAAVVGKSWPDDEDKLRPMIASAKRAVMADHQIVIGTERKAGLVRLAGGEIIKSGSQSIARIRRESQRGLKRLACVDYASLSAAEQAKHNAAASHLGVLGEFSRPKTVAKVVDACDKVQQKLTIDETLKAFRG